MTEAEEYDKERARWAHERRIVVYGIAQSQGSKSARVVNGRPILTEGFGDAPKRRKAWRSAVADAARAWIAQNGAPAPLDGAVALSVRFYLPRPASAPRRVQKPCKKPDLDKMCRSVIDARSGLFFVDDARITDLKARKLFAEDSPPRAEITVWPLGA